MKNSKQLTAIKVASIAVTAFAVSSGSVLAQGNSGNAPGQQKKAPATTATPPATTSSGNNGNGNNTPPVVTPPVVTPPVVTPPVVTPPAVVVVPPAPEILPIPAVPKGWLSAYPTLVQQGTQPMLSWAITHPSTIESYTTIDGSNVLTTLQELDVDIRVIGAGVTTGGSSGNNASWVATQAQISVNNASYLEIFYGLNSEVAPDQLVWSKRVPANTEFRFGGRYYIDGQWSTTYNSSSESKNVRILKNGEYPPTAYALASSEQLKTFMAPYVDGGGRVKIGPLDAIVMMELTQPDSNTNSPFYNLQDMVLLVTAKPMEKIIDPVTGVKSNNGHGNNIDGVDVSNPGKGKGGPNGRIDPSGTVDDERK